MTGAAKKKKSAPRNKYLKILSTYGGNAEEKVVALSSSEATVDRALTHALKAGPFVYGFQILKARDDEGPTIYIGNEIRDVSLLDGSGASESEKAAIRQEDDVLYAVKARNDKWYPLYRNDIVYNSDTGQISKISTNSEVVPYKASRPEPRG